jgi:hypothetical protein
MDPEHSKLPEDRLVATASWSAVVPYRFPCRQRMKERVDWERFGNVYPMWDLHLTPEIKYFPFHAACDRTRKGKL